MDTTTPVPQSERQERELIAPLWHTIALVVFLIVFSLGGAKGQHTAAKHAGLAYFYLVTMAFEWIVVAYIAWGLHRRRKLTSERADRRTLEHAGSGSARYRHRSWLLDCLRRACWWDFRI